MYFSKTFSFGTEEAVQSGIASRVFIEGEAEDAEKAIRRGEAIVEKCIGPFFMLIYDIPTDKNKQCPNPSGKLWKHGFRLNLSCWVLPAKELQSATVRQLLALWERESIETHIIEFAESQVEKVKAIAVKKLEDEVRRQHSSLLALIESADKALRETMDDFDADWAAGEAYRDNRVRAAIKKASEGLDAAIACAAIFDDSMQTRDLIEALRAAFDAQREAFNAAMLRKGSKLA